MQMTVSIIQCGRKATEAAPVPGGPPADIGFHKPSEGQVLSVELLPVPGSATPQICVVMLHPTECVRTWQSIVVAEPNQTFMPPLGKRVGPVMGMAYNPQGVPIYVFPLEDAPLAATATSGKALMS